MKRSNPSRPDHAGSLCRIRGGSGRRLPLVHPRILAEWVSVRISRYSTHRRCSVAWNNLNAHDQLEAIHKFVSRAGGLIGAGLIAADIIRYFSPVGRRGLAGKVALLLAAGSIAAALIWPAVAVAVILAFTVTPIVAVLLGAVASLSGRLLASAAASLMLINILLVQRSPVLGPDISWHAYHLLIAAWLVAIVIILTWQQAGRGKQVAG